MSIWDDIKGGLENGVGGLGGLIAGWLGMGNDQNGWPEDIDYVLYFLVGTALLVFIIMLFTKLF